MRTVSCDWLSGRRPGASPPYAYSLKLCVPDIRGLGVGSRNRTLRRGMSTNPLLLPVEAGIAYAITVFAVGFLLGTVRVLALEPRVGSAIAVSIEAPIMLTVCWCVSSIWMRRLRVMAENRTRIAVGAVAFATLMILELTLSVSL